MAGLRVVKDVPFDPFKLEGLEEYSIDKFYTSASDKYGNNGQVTLYLRRELLASIWEMLGTKAVPEYKTFQHIARDALHHRMEYLRDVIQTPEWDDMVRAERRRSVAARVGRELDEIEEEVKKLSEMLQKAQQMRHTVALARLCEQYEDQLDEFGEPFRSMVEELIRRYKP